MVVGQGPPSPMRWCTASALPAGHFDRLCDVCASRDVAVRRIRFAIEDVRRRSQDQVVAFPRQPGVR